MKRFLFFLALLISSGSYGQTIQITDLTATAATGGINVNLKTISLNGAGYLSHEYTITGNTVDLSVCYWFNATLPVLTFDDNFFIPVSSPDNYTVNVTVYNSTSAVTCDYFSIGGTASTTVLASPGVVAQKSFFEFYPNPTTGIAMLADTAKSLETIAIYDVTGKLVAQFTDTTTIDLTNLQSGMYVLKMMSGNQVAVRRIVKN